MVLRACRLSLGYSPALLVHSSITEESVSQPQWRRQDLEEGGAERNFGRKPRLFIMQLVKPLSTLLEFCQKWKLEVNTEKKTKYASLEGITVLIYSS